MEAMGIQRSATPEDHLRALAAGQASLLERLAQLQVGAMERSGLDEETYLLVRLAALVATDAAPVAYRTHLGAAGDDGPPMAKVLGTFVAIAPVVGSARVLSAAATLCLAGLVPAELDQPAAGSGRITPSG
jgi:4-carboxymuconolactone decarboxylase